MLGLVHKGLSIYAQNYYKGNLTQIGRLIKSFVAKNGSFRYFKQTVLIKKMRNPNP